MRKCLFSRTIAFSGALIAVMVTATQVQAQPDPAAAVWGGGRAVVTNEEGFLPPGVVTSIGLTATIQTSGEVLAGHFTCMIQGGFGGLTANLTHGEDLGNGCVVLYGTSTCIFPTIGVFFDEPITLYVCAGGPGEGGFSLCFDNFPEFGCDDETVINGVINYHSN